MTRDPRGRIAWAAPLLLFLAILLVTGLAFNVANLETGGESVPAAPSAGGTSGSDAGILPTQTIQIGLVVILGSLFVAALVMVLLRKRTPSNILYTPFSIWNVLFAFAGMAFFLILLYLWGPLIKKLGSSPEQNATGNPGLANGTTLGSAAGLPAGLFLAASIFAGLVVAAVVLKPNLRFWPARTTALAPRRQAADAVRATIADLQLGGDIREAILACFRRFCEILGARGITRQDPLTPRELQDLAVSRLGVPREAAEDLTGLFEESRYSEHPLGDADRDRAVRSLEGIRAALEG